jgi:hypothetical protein
MVGMGLSSKRIAHRRTIETTLCGRWIFPSGGEKHAAQARWSSFHDRCAVPQDAESFENAAEFV